MTDDDFLQKHWVGLTPVARGMENRQRGSLSSFKRFNQTSQSQSSLSPFTHDPPSNLKTFFLSKK